MTLGYLANRVLLVQLLIRLNTKNTHHISTTNTIKNYLDFHHNHPQKKAIKTNSLSSTTEQENNCLKLTSQLLISKA